MTRALVWTCVAVLGLAALPSVAGGALPGDNGWIAFDRGIGDSDLFVVAPGQAAQPLGGSVAGANDARPSWAPPPRFKIREVDKMAPPDWYVVFEDPVGEITGVTVAGTSVAWTSVGSSTIKLSPGALDGRVCVTMKDPILQANPDAVVRVGAGGTSTPDCPSQPLAFQSDRSGDYDIWAYVPALGTSDHNPVNLTRSPGVHDTAPAWSPVAARDATILNVSPDRDRPLIAFESDRNENRDIMVLDPAQPLGPSNPTPLTTSPADDANPEWAPTGAYLAFESDRDGQKDIYTLRVERNPRPEIDVRKLTAGQPPAYDPTWWMSEGTDPSVEDPSAGGDPSVIFYSGEGEAGDCELNWMEAYDTELPPVDPDRAYVLPRPGSDEDAPALAPRNGDLALQSGGNLYLLPNGATGAGQPLTTGAGPDRHASWQSLLLHRTDHVVQDPRPHQAPQETAAGGTCSCEPGGRPRLRGAACRQLRGLVSAARRDGRARRFALGRCRRRPHPALRMGPGRRRRVRRLDGLRDPPSRLSDGGDPQRGAAGRRRRRRHGAGATGGRHRP